MTRKGCSLFLLVLWFLCVDYNHTSLLPRYVTDGILPGDLLVRRHPFTYFDKNGIEIDEEIETHFLVLKLVPSQHLKGCEHVLCFNLQQNSRDVAFTISFGNIRLANAHEWRLYRGGVEFAFQEDYGYP